MHKMWMVIDARRVGFLGAAGVMAVATILHFVVMSSPRYCDHWGWCATSPVFVPGQPVAPPGAR
ncbi:hypothetical protein [Roseomonas sp. CECT 9278]|uniref:hypothetical protein n=1 Tax=Roseomonas sp. CECT 9278 TaxID=2845823 RepID=UPI001E6369DD|nr:hypothetical protein [Roseomonas sp. CECT 9278]CAH0276220.1 hypothetical protein ROS9278_03809 [Roseomonas sp. CECT 9278]